MPIVARRGRGPPTADKADAGKRRRVEHWDNAVSQGQHWARVIRGDRQPFVHVTYFFSDVFDLSYELWGDSEGATQTIARGDLSSSSFSIWWLQLKSGVNPAVFDRIWRKSVKFS